MPVETPIIRIEIPLILKCLLCDRSYKTARGYLRHVKAKHKELTNDLEIILWDLGLIKRP